MMVISLNYLKEKLNPFLEAMKYHQKSKNKVKISLKGASNKHFWKE